MPLTDPCIAKYVRQAPRVIQLSGKQFGDRSGNFSLGVMISREGMADRGYFRHEISRLRSWVTEQAPSFYPVVIINRGKTI
jgi:hypothetical protein